MFNKNTLTTSNLVMADDLENIIKYYSSYFDVKTINLPKTSDIVKASDWYNLQIDIFNSSGNLYTVGYDFFFIKGNIIKSTIWPEPIKLNSSKRIKHFTGKGNHTTTAPSGTNTIQISHYNLFFNFNGPVSYTSTSTSTNYISTAIIYSTSNWITNPDFNSQQEQALIDGTDGTYLQNKTYNSINGMTGTWADSETDPSAPQFDPGQFLYNITYYSDGPNGPIIGVDGKPTGGYGSQNSGVYIDFYKLIYNSNSTTEPGDTLGVDITEENITISINNNIVKVLDKENYPDLNLNSIDILFLNVDK